MIHKKVPAPDLHHTLNAVFPTQNTSTHTLCTHHTHSTDACSQSPGRVPAVVTVGASDSADASWPPSNGGPCVDLHAPGASVVSATWYGVDAMVAASGTSMAAPAVAGAAALVLAGARDGDLPPPGAVAARLVEAATEGAVRGVTNGTTTRLLYVPPRVAGAAGVTSPLAVTPADLAPVVAFQNTDNLNATRTLTLMNTGQHALTWTARADAQGLAAGWLSVAPPRGTLPPGEASTLKLHYDVSGAQFQGANVADVVVTAAEEGGATPTIVTRRTEALVFCARLAGAADAGARRLDALTVTGVALDRPDGWPATVGDGDVSAPRAYITLLATLSHPLRADGLPAAWVTVNVAPAVDVTPGGPDGRQCSQFVVRAAVAAEAWATAAVDACVTTAAAALRDARGTLFPPLHACVSVPLPARAILLAPLAPSAGGGGAQFGGASVALLAAASAPLGAHPAPSDFDVTGAPGAWSASRPWGRAGRRRRGGTWRWGACLLIFMVRCASRGRRGRREKHAAAAAAAAGGDAGEGAAGGGPGVPVGGVRLKRRERESFVF